MILGCLAAVVGEIINARNMGALDSSWYLSLGLIVGGTLVLLVGLSIFALASDQVRGFGFFGSSLLILGGLLLIIGTISLDWIVLPLLIHLADNIAAAYNVPATATQSELNKIIAALDNLESSTLLRLFPGVLPKIPNVHIPMVNGISLVNKTLTQLHLPTIDTLAWWGHFSLSGGPLTIGGLILGLALLRRDSTFTSTGILLTVCAAANLLCQFLTVAPAYWGNITAAALFLSMAWLGASTWFSRPSVKVVAEEVEVYEDVPRNERLVS
jgi:hypothetical protein